MDLVVKNGSRIIISNVGRGLKYIVHLDDDDDDDDAFRDSSNTNITVVKSCNYYSINYCSIVIL